MLPVGTGSSIGNYDLTNSYQIVYSRTGGAVYAVIDTKYEQWSMQQEIDICYTI